MGQDYLALRIVRIAEENNVLLLKTSRWQEGFTKPVEVGKEIPDAILSGGCKSAGVCI
jgi:flagellar biosynthesis protein FlhB